MQALDFDATKYQVPGSSLKLADFHYRNIETEETGKPNCDARAVSHLAPRVWPAHIPSFVKLKNEKMAWPINQTLVC